MSPFRLLVPMIGFAVLFPPDAGGGIPQDTTVIVADAPPLWGEGLSLVEELRIGALEGSVEEAFGRVTAVVPAVDGSLLIVDEMTPTVSRFSNTGDFIESLGRGGEGPGEYRRISGLDVLPDGSFVFADARLSRISWLSPDWLEEASMPFAGGFFTTRRTTQIGKEGSVYFHRILLEPGVSLTDAPMVSLAYRPGQRRPDTIYPPPEEKEGPSYAVGTVDGWRFPFTVRTISWMSPHGYLVWARNDDYNLHLELQGGRVLQIRRPVTRLPVSGGEWQQWMGVSNGFQRSRGTRHERIPNWKPFFRDLWVDSDGRIWVERYVKAEKYEYTQGELEGRDSRFPLNVWREPTVFDVFAPAGAFLGEITLPPRTSLMYAKGDQLWAVQTGDFDESYVVRFRILRPD